MAVGLVAAVALSVQVVQSTIGGSPPSGPTSSSYATAAEGSAALASLIEASGGSVTRRRVAFDEGRPVSPGATLFVVDVGLLGDGDVFALRRFLDDGGRLVAGGVEASSWISTLTGASLEAASAPGRSADIVSVDDGGGARSIARGGDVGWDPATLPPTARVVASAEGVPMVVALVSGRGTVFALADTTALRNHALGVQDDAAFALALVAGRPAVFAEQLHGYGPNGGLGGLPARWRWCLALLLCAALAWMVSRGRRNGPTESATRHLPPPRRDYVDALAVTLARSRRRHGDPAGPSDDTSPAVVAGAGEERR